MFKPLIARVKSAADSKWALFVLGVISFLESAMLPIPVDPFALPIMLANKRRLWQAAHVATLTSIAGGCLGYFIGFALFETLGEWIIATYQMEEAYAGFQASLNEDGAYLVLLAALTPIPFKLVAIAAGAAKFSLPLFFLAAAIGRGARFYAMAGAIWWLGPSITIFMEKRAGLVTALILIGTIAGFAAIYFF